MCTVDCKVLSSLTRHAKSYHGLRKAGSATCHKLVAEWKSDLVTSVASFPVRCSRPQPGLHTSILHQFHDKTSSTRQPGRNWEHQRDSKRSTQHLVDSGLRANTSSTIREHSYKDFKKWGKGLRRWLRHSRRHASFHNRQLTCVSALLELHDVPHSTIWAAGTLLLDHYTW